MNTATRVDTNRRRGGHAATDAVTDRLADGCELIGEYRGTGRVETPFLVRRPDGRMLELSPLLYSMSSCLNGRRRPSEIAVIVSAECGRSVTADNVAYLIDHKLRPLGLLHDPGAAYVRAGADPLLALHMRAALIPKSAVRVATKVLWPLFSPFAVVLVLATLAGLDAWMILGHRFGGGAKVLLYHPALLLMVIGFTLVAAVLHELGHATASRYGGAQPGLIGVGVYLIWPVFCNDLNDSYRLSRGGRLRADLGGVYFNVVFIVALAAGYGLTGYQPLLVVVVVQHLVIGQQFLPFLRLDGYYVVSDLAGVPDLFGRIRPILVNLMTGRSDDSRIRDLTRRARLIVTAWVVTTVPLLLAAVVWLAISIPRLFRVGRYSLGIASRVLVASLKGGHLVPGLLSSVQILAVAFPVIGLSVTAFRGLRRCASRESGRPSPAITTILGTTIVILLAAGISGITSHHRVRPTRPAAAAQPAHP